MEANKLNLLQFLSIQKLTQVVADNILGQIRESSDTDKEWKNIVKGVKNTADEAADKGN